MAELSQAIGYRLQPQVFQPISPTSYFNRQLPVQPAINADKVAKAQVFGSLVKALGELPGQLNKEWIAGKKRGIEETEAEKKRATEKQVRAKFDTALTSNSSDLSNFSVDAAGGVSFKPANKELQEAQIAHLKNTPAGAKPAKPTLHATHEARFTGAALPGASLTGDSIPEVPGEVTIDPSGVSGGVETGAPLPVSDDTSASSTTGALFPDSIPLDVNEDLSSVSPEQMQQIDAGIGNAVDQLSGLTPESLTASNEPAGQPADIKPMAVDPNTGQVVVKKALPVTGKSVNHKTGEIYIRSATGAVETYDPITRNISMKTPDGRKFELLPDSNSWKEIPSMGTKPSALLMREAAQMGVDTDGMTNGQIAAAMESKEKELGTIRPSRLPVAQSLARLVVGHPALKHYPTIKEAKEAVDAGLANPDTGGFSDMALVEGFQRMVNPGATVRSQTMQQMLKAAGLAQYADLGFLMDHFTEGQKFAPEVRQRLSKLANDIFDRATKNAAPQLTGMKKLARSYGITNPDDFISNVLVMAPVLSAAGNPEGTPGQPVASEATANLSQKDKEAADWVKANPNDPRTPKIKAALKARGIPVE